MRFLSNRKCPRPLLGKCDGQKPRQIAGDYNVTLASRQSALPPLGSQMLAVISVNTR